MDIVSWNIIVGVTFGLLLLAAVAGVFAAVFTTTSRALQLQAVQWRNVSVLAARNPWFRDGLSLRIWTVFLVSYVVLANVLGFGFRGALAHGVDHDELNSLLVLGGAIELLSWIVLLIAAFAWHEMWPERGAFRELFQRCTRVAHCVVCFARRRQQYCHECGTQVP